MELDWTATLAEFLDEEHVYIHIDIEREKEGKRERKENNAFVARIRRSYRSFVPESEFYSFR